MGALALTATQQYVYATTFTGVREIALTDPPTLRNVPGVEPTDPLIFSQADSIAVDLVNNRAIVGDTDLSVLIAVDLTTGERFELLSRKIGAGPPLIVPSGLTFNAAGDTAYVVDGGGNGSEKLFELDLATGDRRVIGQIHDPGVNRSLKGVVLDEEAGVVYVARYDGGTVLRVELDTENVTPITSQGDGLLEGINDMVLDRANGRLLLADEMTDAIVAVDLLTNDKQLISRGGERGEGPAFDTLVSLSLTADGTAVYAAEHYTTDIYRVDLETGNRELVETTCSSDAIPWLRQVLYDPAADQLLILSDDLFIFDFATSDCRQVTLWVDPVDIRIAPDGRLLGAAFNAITQIDPQTGNIAIIAK